MSNFIVEPAATPADAETETLLDAAFGPLRRMKASYRLREGAEPAPGLSFTAREKATGRLAGVVSFWPLRLAGDGRPALLLGPLAVHPDFQNNGVGAMLMHHGLAEAKARGHALVFLVGDEPYYGRHGFAVVPEGQLLMPGPFDPERLLYHELEPGAFAGAAGLILPAHRWKGRAEPV